MANVVIASGKDIAERTRKALASLRLQVPEDKDVLIKPNHVEPLPPSSGAVTRPEVVEGIIQFFRGKRIRIGESSATYENARCFELAGYHRFVDKYKVELVDLDKRDYVTLKLDSEFLEEVEVSKLALSSYLISVAVLKEHGFGVTLSMKNMMGVIKPKGTYPNKSYMHPEGDHHPFAHRLCALLNRVKPDLAVIDGTTAMYGSHLYGKLKKLNLTIASTDACSADVVGTRLLGHEDDVYYINLALRKGIGEMPSKVIEV